MDKEKRKTNFEKLYDRVYEVKSLFGTKSAKDLAKFFGVQQSDFKKFLDDHELFYANRSPIEHQEFKKKIVELYNQGLSHKKISKKLGCSQGRVWKYISQCEVEQRDCRSYRPYKLNEEYFDEINTNEKAYILGFIYADGHNDVKKGQIKIKIQQRDKHLLEYFNKVISPEKPNSILTEIPKNPNAQKQSIWLIYSRRVSDKLNEIGCGDRKSLTCEFPNIPNDFVNSFIAGYFDGDGHISFQSNRPSLIANSICVNDVFFEGLHKAVLENLNFSLHKYKISATNKIKTAKIGKVNDAIKFFEWIYKDTPIKLDRKYQKFLEIKEFRKNYARKRV